MEDDPFNQDEITCPYCLKLVNRNDHDFAFCADPNGGDGQDD